MTATSTARRLAGHEASQPMVSLYLDLDPSTFATPRARRSQIRSLIDGACQEIDGDASLDHAARTALRQDIERIDEYLSSDEPPLKGARALAVFCSIPDDLFEVVAMTTRAEGQVVIERRPYIEPLTATPEEVWCVVLVNRRDARVFAGHGEHVSERRRLADDTHGQHRQGGLSQPRYERSVEKDVEDHLRRTADLLHRRFRLRPFDHLVLAGPVEIVPQLEKLLHAELKRRLVAEHLDLDVGSAADADVQRALASLVATQRRSRVRQALDRFAEANSSGGRAAGGPEETLAALAARRVQTLLIAADFRRAGARCPRCGLLALSGDGECPVDDTPLEVVSDLGEAAVEAAVAQDAEVLTIAEEPDLGPFQGIAALLRF
jgi:peptide chain release factor subunit 1